MRYFKARLDDGRTFTRASKRDLKYAVINTVTGYCLWAEDQHQIGATLAHMRRNDHKTVVPAVEVSEVEHNAT